jgi:hypothetical protein
MTVRRRQIYLSSNGDRWHLVHDGDLGDVFVKHEANLSSGGHETKIELVEFLDRDRQSPQCAALLRLIATLVDSAVPASQDT